MIETVEVYLWGTRIGILHQPEGRAYASFEYDRDFVLSGIELSPIMMPLSNRLYEFPTLVGDAFHGMPGLVADSLPDKFGNAVINRWLLTQGKSLQDFNALDRLCYTGTRAMGALEYVPARGPSDKLDQSINVDEMVRFASEVLSNRQNIDTHFENSTGYAQLVQLGTSAGGARAKAIIAWNEKTNDIRSGQINLPPEYSHWLIKFDGVNRNGDHGEVDSPKYTLIEYAYHLMAKRAGIEMNECRILHENNRSHFMTKRFDRVNGQKIHMQTLGAIAHIDYNVPNLCSYEQAAQIMKQMNLSAADVLQLYRRMIFNVMAVNQDDHVKNISFLMDRRGQWKLSPAYDVTFAYNAQNRWLAAHQMLINGKKEHLQIEDLIECGKTMDLTTKNCKRVIEEVRASVQDWSSIAEDAGVPEQNAQLIQQVIKQQNAEMEQ